MTRRTKAAVNLSYQASSASPRIISTTGTAKNDQFWVCLFRQKVSIQRLFPIRFSLMIWDERTDYRCRAKCLVSPLNSPSVGLQDSTSKRRPTILARPASVKFRRVWGGIMVKPQNINMPLAHDDLLNRTLLAIDEQPSHWVDRRWACAWSTPVPRRWGRIWRLVTWRKMNFEGFTLIR